MVYTKHRDFLQIVGETARQKKNHCCEKCRECKKKFTSCGKEKKNFVAFCGARADNFSKPRADISYSETIDGKIKVIFWSDESKQGNGFLCRFINKDRLLERSSVSVAGRARSLVRATPHPCGKNSSFIHSHFLLLFVPFRFSSQEAGQGNRRMAIVDRRKQSRSCRFFARLHSPGNANDTRKLFRELSSRRRRHH